MAGPQNKAEMTCDEQKHARAPTRSTGKLGKPEGELKQGRTGGTGAGGDVDGDLDSALEDLGALLTAYQGAP